jgi:hypothetical protein
MGLLDEAIKEHLELKRRHGADPGEVARLEHEALGPARRDPAPAATVDEPVAPQDPDLEDDREVYDEATAEEGLEAPVDPVEHEAAEADPELAVEVEQPTRQFSLEEVQDASPASAAPAREKAPDEPEAPPPSEDVVPADEEPEGEDVLEETPEFLQETPEHDRLWFEQKPPRDFDF